MDGFILAGGRSKRMGVDKARVPFPGSEPMAIGLARVLASVCERVVLVRRDRVDDLPWVLDGRPLEVIRDGDDREPHPLNGVVAALQCSRSERAVVVPCDVPHLDADDFRALDTGAPTCASDGERLHPLVGVYPKEWMEKADDLARQGRSVHAFVSGVRAVVLPAAHLENFNTWEATGRVGPVRALLARLDGLGDPDRIAAGELGRLAGIGVIDPEQAIRYARVLSGESP